MGLRFQSFLTSYFSLTNMDTETLKILTDISWAGVIVLSIVFIVKPLIEFVLNMIIKKPIIITTA